MRIYSAPVLAQVMHIKHVLEMHDIACHIQGEYRSGAAAAGRPVAMCAAIAGWPVRWAWTRSPAHKRAVVRPPPPPPRPAGARARSYAVPRRTKRRGEAGRGAAELAAWGRLRAGTACACCAR